ncbi:hypothetical protein [Blastomonas fulva]|uniref:hypothetical protein n=1 Tax=Blastomonas fulva TaxID=1550728 RepID=UPI0013C2C837|nr:hypothetical protein [Blastomonas fulva]
MGSQPLSGLFLRLAALCLAALTAGCSLFGDDWLDKAEKAASGPQAMWYRVQFEADYGSQRVKIDQMVTCTTTYISGGFLGQSPNSAVTEAYPKTAGVDLADGSRVVVRVPDMCRRNRAFVTAADGDLEMVRGWEKVGSFDVMPLVIWSERSRDPERMESYISRDYYLHPEARFKNAKGTLTLWEVGRIPENVREILSAPPFEPFSPNPWVDPERAKRVSMEERLKGYDREGYHGNGPRYAAYTITEIDSVEEWWTKYLDYAQRIGFRLEDVRNKPEPEPDYETKDVSVWPTASDIMGRWVGDPDFVYADCPRRYIYDLMVGVPRMSDLPFNSQDGGAIISGITISENGPYVPDYKNPDYRLKAMQSRACAKRAAETRTFDIIDGHLDASKAIPGVLVYRKWGFQAGIGTGTPPVLRDTGVIVSASPWGMRHRLLGISTQTNSYDLRDTVVKMKPSKRWFVLGHQHHIYTGRTENSHF